ncbi:MAG TPA: PEGA domain-containing protein, partial [Bryobacteraceae bacterium]|nr:PEGA domain-containing protein [Bryobacteraceae bacterium]
PSPVGDSAQTAKPALPPAPPPAATKPQAPAETARTEAAPQAVRPDTTKPSANSADNSSLERPPSNLPPARVRSVPAAVAPSRGETEQQVQFVTEPIGAQLTVDGNSELSCKAPCFLQLNPGRHSLNVSLDGYRPYPKIFNVPEEREIFLQLTKASGTLRVTTIPDGATILVNGESQPQHTPAIFNLAPGNYRVRVSRNGQAYDFDVVVHDGDFITKSVNWNSR